MTSNGNGRHGYGTPLVQVRGLCRRYGEGPGATTVLDDVSLDVAPGEFVAITGPSGSGKSTLLNLIAGIDRADAGTIRVGGRELQGMSEEALARWRGREVGIIFQFFQMLPALTLLHNVMLPMDLAGTLPGRARRERAMALLEQVGLADRAGHLPSMVSGGQQQRAAIARALANEPALLVADEPTGNLDSATSEHVFALFQQLVADGKTLVMVTHSLDLAARAGRTVELRDGRIMTPISGGLVAEAAR